MQRYEGAIFHLINRMVFSEDDAEDLTIETFTKAFKRLNQYTPAFAFSTWLFKIASNHTIDFIRKKRINALSLDRGFTNDDGDRMEISVKDDGLDPMEALQKQERIERMREVVAQLKDRYRRLVELRYFEEKATKSPRNSTFPLGTVKASCSRQNMMAKCRSVAKPFDSGGRPRRHSPHFPGLTDAQLDQLDAIAQTVWDWNQRINVISRKEGRVMVRHVLHSLGIAKVMPGLNLEAACWMWGLGAVFLVCLWPCCILGRVCPV